MLIRWYLTVIVPARLPQIIPSAVTGHLMPTLQGLVNIDITFIDFFPSNSYREEFNNDIRFQSDPGSVRAISAPPKS
jgi:hypothetical protein